MRKINIPIRFPLCTSSHSIINGVSIWDDTVDAGVTSCIVPAASSLLHELLLLFSVLDTTLLVLKSPHVPADVMFFAKSVKKFSLGKAEKTSDWNTNKNTGALLNWNPSLISSCRK